VRATQSCASNFNWASAWSLEVRGIEKESKEQKRKVGVVSATFLRALESKLFFESFF
jgi:hypothetical protein